MTATLGNRNTPNRIAAAYSAVLAHRRHPVTCGRVRAPASRPSAPSVDLVVRACVSLGGAQEQLDQQCGGAVEHDRGPLRRAAVVKGLRQHAGRERQERRRHQQQQVQAQQDRVDETQPREQAVVSDPDAPHGQEARHVGQVRGPLVREGVPEMVVVGRRDGDVEYEQRDRDREHPVAEYLDATLVPPRLPGGVAVAGRAAAVRHLTGGCHTPRRRSRRRGRRAGRGR